jgi:hypothetical protein
MGICFSRSLDVGRKWAIRLPKKRKPLVQLAILNVIYAICADNQAAPMRN